MDPNESTQQNSGDTRSYSHGKDTYSEPTSTQLVTDGGLEDGESYHIDSSNSGSLATASWDNGTPSVTTQEMIDPGSAHPESLKGRRVRIDWGAREEVGEIREVRDHIERGRKLRIGLPNEDDGWSRMVMIDPSEVDIELLSAGGDSA